VNSKFWHTASNFNKNQKGITGLETAIILIAFVTVASILAYTVLSAGIFSSERGKEAVYGGLNSAQSTMSLKGSVLVVDNADLQFDLAMVIAGSSVDLTKLVFNYWNATSGVHEESLTGTFKDATDPSGGDITSVSGNTVVQVVVTPADVAALEAYDTFTLQIIPPTGAAITIQRTMPGDTEPAVISLN
jgi:archaeal flagellin FlaB